MSAGGLRARLRNTRHRIADRLNAGARAELAAIAASQLFDAGHYLAGSPDVARAGADPLRHFVRGGWRENRDPHPLFDVAYYLRRNPDVARAGVNPLTHFITVGWREGRNPHPLFDTSHYLDAYPDVAEAGLNPLAHFATTGWREGRNPQPWFDTAFYAAGNPDVAGLNPLVHFATWGIHEGRHPSPHFDEELPLPLPEWSWLDGQSHVERVLRTLVFERDTPLADGDLRRLLGEIEARAAAQGALTPAGGAQTPVASLIVPVFNQLKLTLWCLYALLAGGERTPFEVVVVDDGSVDATATAMAALPWVRLVRSPGNQGFIRACNLGAAQARGEHLVFLNNDTLPLPGWLDALADTLRDQPSAAMVGSKLVYPDGRQQEAGGIVWQNGAVWNYGRGGDRHRPEFNYLRSVDFCSGATLAVRRALFHDAGGFDEALAPGYGEDVDLALRLRHQGHEVLYQPLSEVVHLEGASGGTSTRRGMKAHQAANLDVLFERWRLALRPHRREGREPHLEKDRDAERRALFLDSFTPRPDQDAGSLDALHWMRSLAALGFQVTFVPFRDPRHAGRYTRDLERLGIECIYSPHVAQAEDLLAARGSEFDLCVFYRYEVADALLPAVRRLAPQARRLLALCDLAHVRMQRGAELTGSEKERRAAYEARLRELLACLQCDALWTPSTWEKEHLERELPAAEVMAWPLAHEVRPPASGFAQRSGVGFIGGYRHAPNVDAVLYFIREVLPLALEEDPTLVFHVAGSHMPPEIADIDHPAVKVMGQVPDLALLFESVRVFAAPIRFGAGLKGKVVSSLCFGVPVVGTSVALEGFTPGPETGTVLADDPRALAREVVRIHRDPDLWARLSSGALRHATEHYSTAARTRHVAAAVVRLGVGTRRSRSLLGDEPNTDWADLPGLEVDVCREQAEYDALRASETVRERLDLEARVVAAAEAAEVAYRAYSVPARRPVVFRASLPSGSAARECVDWREQLVCPITRLNNRQRAIATFARRLMERGTPPLNDVYLTEQVTPLYDWMRQELQTVSVTGSEYLGADVAPGTQRDGLSHQDVERLSLGTASQDLIVSCDVLEHVNEPRAALAEFARVLRPGGRLLFTVPFHADRAQNQRRARVKDGAVEHLVAPEYHGNPLDPRGSLACFDFGWELLDWVRAAGFSDVSVLCYWSATHGHLGGILEAFLATR